MIRTVKRRLIAICFCLLTLFVALGIAIAPKKAVADTGSFTMQKTTFEEGEEILVTATGEGKDWIGIFREGETTSIYWYYVAEKPSTFNVLNGSPNAGVNNYAITAGTYVIAFIPNDMSGLANATQTQTITVTSNETGTSALKVNKTNFRQGEAIYVTATGSGLDWVGIYREGETLSTRWYYVADAGSGATIDFTVYGSNNAGNGIVAELIPGNYTIYLVRNDGAYTEAEVAIPITITTAQYMSVDKTEFALKEPIYVTATHPTAGAWVGLYRRTESEYCRWYYISSANNVPYDIAQGEKNIETSFSPNVMRGEYVLRLMVPSGGTSVAVEEIAISVVGDNTVPSAPISATYTLGNNTDGFATGTVSVTMPSNDMTNRCIALFWGNDKGVFENYSYIKFHVTGETTNFTFGKYVTIPYGATKLYVYAKNTNGDALSQECVTVDLPKGAAPKNPLNTDTDTSFWVISDTHIDQDTNHVHNQNLKNALGDIARIDGDAMSLVINGDMTNRGREGDFANFQNICDSATGVPPIVLAMGNHEYYNNTYENVNNKFYAMAKYPDGTLVNKMHFDYWQGGYHFIFLGTDTVPQGFTHAVMSEETLQWFDRVLDEGKDEGKPTFVFLHQPMYNTVAGSRPGEDYSGVEANTEARLRQILADHPEVMMFNGHTHWTMNAEANIYEGTSDLPTTIFNTSSAGYLWTTYDNASGDYLYGSEGYYVRIYGGTMYVMGYDFIADKWIAAAQYCIPLSGCDTCVDNDNNHLCDVCGATSDCTDENKDHACDICGTNMGTHEAAQGTHVCGYCKQNVSSCVDNDNNHKCDICNETISDCLDENKDHACDICRTNMGAHEVIQGTHVCGYCNQNMSSCIDNDGNHKCDICNETISDCLDENKDHACDVCGNALSVCGDNNNDNACDICGKEMQQMPPNIPNPTPPLPDTDEENGETEDTIEPDTQPNITPKPDSEMEKESGCKGSVSGLGVIGLGLSVVVLRKKRK